MNRNFRIVEKLISIALILWGCMILYFAYSRLSISLETVFKYRHAAWSDISSVKIFENYYFEIILSLLALVGGLFLILNKKIGWIVSLITTTLNGLLLLFALIKLPSSNKDTSGLMLARIFVIILFFSMAIVLTLAPFRGKYYPTVKTWILITCCTILLTALSFI
jgi:uncharacterized membrane protein (UPF0136 family)